MLQLACTLTPRLYVKVWCRRNGVAASGFQNLLMNWCFAAQVHVASLETV